MTDEKKNTPDKPFKSVDEQINLLQSRNLIITDLETAKNALYNYSYYDLVNGIDNYFLENIHPPIFKNGVSMNTLIQIQILDKQLKSILLDKILFVEKSFKTKMSYLISSSYGVFDEGEDSYLSKKNYSNRRNTMRTTTLSQFKDKICEAKNSKNPNGKISKSLFHYAKNHNHVPPWILFPNMTLGNMEFLYKILRPQDKSYIVKEMRHMSNLFLHDCLSNEEKEKLFIDSIDFIRNYRNWIAHGNILSKFDINVGNNIGILKKVFNSRIISNQDISDGLLTNGLYFLILSIIYLTNDIDQISSFLINLKATYQTLLDFNLQNNFNLPKNFIKRLSTISNIYNKDALNKHK